LSVTSRYRHKLAKSALGPFMIFMCHCSILVTIQIYASNSGVWFVIKYVSVNRCSPQSGRCRRTCARTLACLFFDLSYRSSNVLYVLRAVSTVSTIHCDDWCPGYKSDSPRTYDCYCTAILWRPLRYVRAGNLAKCIVMCVSSRGTLRTGCGWLSFVIFYVKPHYGPGVDSASSRNEYQEPSWG
jgi:hypothetical protein